MDDEKPHELLVTGTAYTPLFIDEGEQYNGTLFSHNQITNDLAEQLKGKDVYVEHDERHPIGQVLDCYVNEKRQLKTILHIHGNDLVNRLLPEKLERVGNKRYYNGLSLGNDVFLTKSNDDVVRVTNNVPKEVSIVRHGDRPDTLIDDFHVVPKTMTAEQYVKEFLIPDIIRF